MDNKEAREAMVAEQIERFRTLYAHQLEARERHAWAALLLSNASPGSGRWLHYTGGATKRFRMGDDLFKDALRLRCMLRPSEAAQIAATRCTCRTVVQQHVTHLLDCKCNQWYYTHRHNTACELLAALIRRIRPDVIIHRESLLRATDDEVYEAENEVVVAVETRGERDGTYHVTAREEGVEVVYEVAEETRGEQESGTSSEEVAADEVVNATENVQVETRGEPETGTSRGELEGGERAEGESGAASMSVAEVVDARAPVGPVTAQVPARATPAVTDNRRSDLVCIFPHARYTIDLSFVNPGCRKYIRQSRSHMTDGAAAAEREKEKCAKYADVPGMGEGGQGGFVPFAVEVTGRLGRAARMFIKEITTLEDTFHTSNFLSALSAMSAMHLSMMFKNNLRKFTELEHVVF